MIHLEQQKIMLLRTLAREVSIEPKATKKRWHHWLNSHVFVYYVMPIYRSTINVSPCSVSLTATPRTTLNVPRGLRSSLQVRKWYVSFRDGGCRCLGFVSLCRRSRKRFICWSVWGGRLALVSRVCGVMGSWGWGLWWTWRLRILGLGSIVWISRAIITVSRSSQPLLLLSVHQAIFQGWSLLFFSKQIPHFVIQLQKICRILQCLYFRAISLVRQFERKVH